MDADEVLLLADHQIDYGSLPEGVLFTLATQIVEPFIQTSALGELSIRGSVRAAEAAEIVLAAGDEFDCYSRAGALTTVFNHAPARGIIQMRRMLESTTDPELLGTMVENVMSDVERFAPGASGYQFAMALTHRLRGCVLAKFADADEVGQFLALFTPVVVE